MSPLPTSVETSMGRTFRLTKEIGKGGEGAVFEAAGETDLAFKLYWPDKAATRREKLSAMAAAQWYKTNPFVAFPIDILFSKGVFVGFVMKKVGGHKPVHLLYSPASRKLEFGKTNFRFLVRSAGNIARGVASVHQTGCVIGDVNESGFLVSDKATSVLIDSDSFQVAAGQKRFLCQVGKAEYTPPELQSAALDKTLRTENHDNFGLAVLAFQLLFMGKHPYAGRYSGREDMPISRAIEECRFAYSDQRAVTKMHPPPGAPLLTDFPPYIAQAFEKAFGRQGNNGRPPAAEWVDMLHRLESELVQCTGDSNHHHVKGRPCPWCRMEQSSPGFIAFGTQHKFAFIPTRVDTSQLLAILNSIGDPGPWPDFASQVGSRLILVATPAASTLVQSLKRRSLMGIGASAVGAILIWYGGGAIMPGLIVLGTGILANVVAPKELSRLRQEEDQANAAFKSVRDIWNKESTDRTFVDAKSRISDTLRQLADIPNQEKRGIAELDQRKKDLQLNRYLAGFLIKKAKIAKVGNGRKATLASYNIETAADIDARRIETIAGFGPSLVAELVSWRRGIAVRFVFNPNEPTNPADLAALKSKLSAKKAAFEKSARDGINTLQQTAAQVRHQRTKLVESGKRAFEASKQAELNTKAADGTLRQSSKFISFCCVGLAALGLLNGGVQKTPPQSAPSTIATSAPASPPVAAPRPAPPAAARPPSLQPQPVPMPLPAYPPPLTQIVPSASLQRPASQPSSPIPPNAVRVPEQTQPPQTIPQPSGPVAAPALPAPVEVRGAPPANAPSTQSVQLLDTSVAADAMRLQQRLIALGFLSGTADGKWGPKSRRALAEFKASKQLDDDPLLDERTQELLLADNVPSVPRDDVSGTVVSSILYGGWTNSQGECGDGGMPPLLISPRGAVVSEGFCEFNNVRQEGNNVWRISASCTVGRDSWRANIRLALTSASLRWSSEKGEKFYYRCPARN